MSARKLDEALQLEATGQWAEAADHYRELLAGSDRALRCRAHIRLARCFLETCKPRETAEAEEALVEASDLLETIDDVTLRGDLLLQQGRLDEHKGKLKRALGRYQEARELLARDDVDLTEVELVLASAERRRGELTKALARLETMGAEDLAPRQLADYYDELGAVRLARGETQPAIAVLEQALELDERTAHAYAGGRSRLLLAEACMLAGKRAHAKALIEEAIDVYAAASATAGLSDAYALKGLWYEDGEDYVSAAQCYQDTYDLDRSSDDPIGQARAKRHLARTFRKRGETERARELIADAARLLPSDDDVESAALLQEQGDLALTGSEPDYELAISFFQRALRIAEEDGDDRVTAIAQRNLARALREDDQLVEAEQLLRAARRTLQERGDLRELDDLLEDLGGVLLERDLYEQAEECLLQSLQLDVQLSRVASKGRTLLLLGQVAARLGQRDRSGEYFRDAYAVFDNAGHEVGRSDALRHLGTWHLEHGQVEQATERLREGLLLDSRLDDPLGRVRAERLLAAAHRMQGDLERAEEYIDFAARDLGAIDDPAERALLDLERGRLGLERGAYRQAETLLRRAQQALEGVGGPVDVAVCKRFLALAAAYQGRYGEALGLLDEARTVFQQRRDVPELDELLDDLGEVYLMAGKIDRAEQCVHDSMDVGTGAGWYGGRGRSLLLLARIAKQRGDFRSARSRLDEALADYDEVKNEVGRVEALLELGDWYQDPANPERDASQAITTYKAARRVEQFNRDRRGVARCNRRLAHVYIAEGQYQRAEEALEDAVASLRQSDDPREQAPLAYELGSLAAARGEHELAITRFTQALEGYRTLSQDDERRATYKQLMTCYQALGQTDEALDCMRQMDAERSSMYRALLKDLHDQIAGASQPNFADERYAAAIVDAFRTLEVTFKERAALLPDPPRSRSIQDIITRWAEARPNDAPRFQTPEGFGKFASFCAASFALFRNPAQHRPPEAMSPLEAFAALSVAHWIMTVLEGTATLGLADDTG
jgi:tetratricopeptide (TPR) repeat protein